MNVVTTHPNLAAAAGAWFAAEMAAAMAHPERLTPEDDDGSGPAGETRFGGIAFEMHLRGLVSDLLEYCTYEVADPSKPVELVVGGAHDPTRETQECLQGHAYFRQAGGAA